MHFEASQAVLWSLLCYKELKLTRKLFTGCVLCSLLIQLQNISLQSSGMCRKQNFEILTFNFRFLFSPLFLLFLPHLFSLAGHLVDFILVGKVFRKAFKILGLNERKGRWVVEQDFPGNFQVIVTWFFAFSSGVLDWIVLIMVWFAGLSLRAGGRGFPPATMSVVPGYFYWKIEEKLEPKETPSCLIPHLLVVFTQQLEILTTTLVWKISSHCTS